MSRTTTTVPAGLMCCGHRPGQCPDIRKTSWHAKCGHGHCDRKPVFIDRSQDPDPWAVTPERDTHDFH